MALPTSTLTIVRQDMFQLKIEMQKIHILCWQRETCGLNAVHFGNFSQRL